MFPTVHSFARVKSYKHFAVKSQKYYAVCSLSIIASVAVLMYIHFKFKNMNKLQSAHKDYGEVIINKHSDKHTQHTSKHKFFMCAHMNSSLDKTIELITNISATLDRKYTPSIISLPIIDEFIYKLVDVFKYVQMCFIKDAKCKQFYYNSVCSIGGIASKFYGAFAPCYLDYLYTEYISQTTDKYDNIINIHVINGYRFVYLSYNDSVSVFSELFTQSSKESALWIKMLSNTSVSMFEDIDINATHAQCVARGLLAERQMYNASNKLIHLYSHNINSESFCAIMTNYGYCSHACVVTPEFGNQAFDAIDCMYTYIVNNENVSIHELLSIVNKFHIDTSDSSRDTLDTLLSSNHLNSKMKNYNKLKLLVGKLLVLRDFTFLGTGVPSSYILSKNSALTRHISALYITRLKTSIPSVEMWGKTQKDSMAGYFRDFSLTHMCSALMTGVFNMLLTYILTR